MVKSLIVCLMLQCRIQPDPDFAIRGGGGGAVAPPKFFEPFRPHFSLKIRRGGGVSAPPGPSPGSATVLYSEM